MGLGCGEDFSCVEVFDLVTRWAPDTGGNIAQHMGVVNRFLTLLLKNLFRLEIVDFVV